MTKMQIPKLGESRFHVHDADRIIDEDITVAVFVFNLPEGGTTFVSGGIGVMSTTSCSGKTSNAVSFRVNP